MATEKREKCPICGQMAYLEEHHITPICYDGPKDGPTIFICGDCHEAIHRTGESLTAKTVKPKNWFKTKEALHKAAPYVQAIMNAKIRKKENWRPESQDNPRRRLLVLEMTDREWVKLHKKQKDCGYSNFIQFIQDFLRKLGNQ
mgnify:CR=1 FL=1